MRISNLNNSNFLANFYFLFHYFSTSITFKHFYGWSSECIIELKSRFLQKIKIPEWKTFNLSTFCVLRWGRRPWSWIRNRAWFYSCWFYSFIYVPINILYVNYRLQYIVRKYFKCKIRWWCLTGRWVWMISTCCCSFSSDSTGGQATCNGCWYNDAMDAIEMVVYSNARECTFLWFVANINITLNI